MLVIFEGRDAAGKGAAIKRVTEYLNPRVARIVALPAPTERERGQWYFQRYVEHLPAARRDRADGPVLVQPGRRRAGDGLLHAGGVPAIHAQCPVFERLLVETASCCASTGSRCRTPSRSADSAHGRRPDAPMEAVPDGHAVDQRDGRNTPGPRTRCSCTPTSEVPWWTVESDDKRRARVNMIAHLLSTVPYAEREPAARDVPGATRRPTLRAAAARALPVGARPRRDTRRPILTSRRAHRDPTGVFAGFAGLWCGSGPISAEKRDIHPRTLDVGRRHRRPVSMIRRRKRGCAGRQGSPAPVRRPGPRQSRRRRGTPPRRPPAGRSPSRGWPPASSCRRP